MTVNQPTLTSLFRTTLLEWQAQFKARRDGASPPRPVRTPRVIRRRPGNPRRQPAQNAEA
jgi:hypothetical protein